MTPSAAPALRFPVAAPFPTLPKAFKPFLFAGATADVPAKSPSFAQIDPGAKPFSSADKAADKARVDGFALELDTLQDVFFAAKRYKLLVILQGMDASGKDGTVRAVFGRMSPLGVHTVSWRAPSEEERAHDYLWRIHRALPGAGELLVSNRSHYEDVLVPPVSGWIDAAETGRRYAQINDFERMLVETGTLVMKFMLHIGKDEQRERLQARLDNPTKHWKFSVGDLEVRKRWDDYQKAYDGLIAATGTPWAPWIVVPADSKTHRNLMIATAMKEALAQLGLEYPAGDPALANLRVT